MKILMSGLGLDGKKIYAKYHLLFELFSNISLSLTWWMLWTKNTPAVICCGHAWGCTGFISAPFANLKSGFSGGKVHFLILISGGKLSFGGLIWGVKSCFFQSSGRWSDMNKWVQDTNMGLIVASYVCTLRFTNFCMRDTVLSCSFDDMKLVEISQITCIWGVFWYIFAILHGQVP